jgi:Protein of unknown function (DUF2846)
VGGLYSGIQIIANTGGGKRIARFSNQEELMGDNYLEMSIIGLCLYIINILLTRPFELRKTMIPRMKEWMIILMILIVAGCASTQPPGKPFSEIVKPSADKDQALVYIYRVGQNSPVTMGFVKIYINDGFVFNVADHGFTWITVKPGLYKFEASWPWPKPRSRQMPFDNRDKVVSVELEAGKTYFVNYSTRQDMVFTDSSERWQRQAVVASMDSESEYEGLNKLESCRFQENEYKP